MITINAESEPLFCHCGAEFGRAFYINGVFIGAEVGRVIVDESLHGKCKCGKGIHLVVNRKAYLKLMKNFGENNPFTLEISSSI